MKLQASKFKGITRWYNEAQLLKVITALKKRGFSAAYFPNASAFVRAIMKKIPKHAIVGIPGSVTIRELGIISRLTSRGNKIIHHWKKGLIEQTDREIRMLEARADYFLTSANAITTDGDIINIDGIGNRIAAMMYGPKHVVIVAGYNKIVSSIDQGIRRSREIAGVMNAKRVGAKTPCVKTGFCIDCASPQRICRVISIIQYCPWQTDISVMLVNEHLGF